MAASNGEFIAKFKDSENSFRISFSEEEAETKVSRLTLSADFTHTYEETFEDEDDMLIVDIDYGEQNQIENRDRKETDSPESLSRSGSLSNISSKQRPKFGLRRFKSVEEVISVSPKQRQKKKLKKTASDYESRYSGLEYRGKASSKLTLSADFTRSYEESFEEDDEMLIVDIDYSKGNALEESYGENIFSASDNFGTVNHNRNESLKKYKSHDDIRNASYSSDTRSLQRSTSGYEITFTNESKPEERSRLSLSSDLTASGEEVLVLADVEKQAVDIDVVEDDAFYSIGKNDDNFVTSTPQKKFPARQKDKGSTSVTVKNVFASSGAGNVETKWSKPTTTLNLASNSTNKIDTFLAVDDKSEVKNKGEIVSKTGDEKLVKFDSDTNLSKSHESKEKSKVVTELSLRLKENLPETEHFEDYSKDMASAEIRKNDVDGSASRYLYERSSNEIEGFKPLDDDAETKDGRGDLEYGLSSSRKESNDFDFIDLNDIIIDDVDSSEISSKDSQCDHSTEVKSEDEGKEELNVSKRAKAYLYIARKSSNEDNERENGGTGVASCNDNAFLGGSNRHKVCESDKNTSINRTDLKEDEKEEFAIIRGNEKCDDRMIEEGFTNEHDLEGAESNVDEPMKGSEEENGAEEDGKKESAVFQGNGKSTDRMIEKGFMSEHDLEGKGLKIDSTVKAEDGANVEVEHAYQSESGEGTCDIEENCEETKKESGENSDREVFGEGYEGADEHHEQFNDEGYTLKNEDNDKVEDGVGIQLIEEDYERKIEESGEGITGKNDKEECQQEPEEASQELEKINIVNIETDIRMKEGTSNVNGTNELGKPCESAGSLPNGVNVGKYIDINSNSKDYEPNESVKCGKFYQIAVIVEDSKEASERRIIVRRAGRLSRFKTSVKRLFVAKDTENNGETSPNKENENEEQLNNVVYAFPWPEPHIDDLEAISDADFDNSGFICSVNSSNQLKEITEDERLGTSKTKNPLSRALQAMKKKPKGKTDKTDKHAEDGILQNGDCIRASEENGNVRDDFGKQNTNEISSIRPDAIPCNLNKVYRMKSKINGEKICTETIRMFLQQERITMD